MLHTILREKYRKKTIQSFFKHPAASSSTCPNPGPNFGGLTRGHFEIVDIIDGEDNICRFPVRNEDGFEALSMQSLLCFLKAPSLQVPAPAFTITEFLDLNQFFRASVVTTQCEFSSFRNEKEF